MSASLSPPFSRHLALHAVAEPSVQVIVYSEWAAAELQSVA